MNFEEALLALGVNIRRASWPPNARLSVMHQGRSLEEFLVFNPFYAVRVTHQDYEDLVPFQKEDFDADEWELVK